jgi:hypothetical protein
MKPLKSFQKKEPEIWWARFNVGYGTGYYKLRAMKAYQEDVLRWYNIIK